jgi:hypothetical protein
MNYNAAKTTDLLETVLNRTRGRYLSEEDAKLVELLMCHRENGKPNKLTDKELIIFLMDEIDNALDLLVDGQHHMATGVLGQCHAEIRKHLSNGLELAASIMDDKEHEYRTTTHEEQQEWLRTVRKTEY